VIDVVDQAILVNYIGDKIEALRPVGIRGAIEMTVLGEPAGGGGTAEQRVAHVIAIVAQRLGGTEAEARNLGDNLYEDGQVDLIWQLYKPYEAQSKLDSPATQPAGDGDASRLLIPQTQGQKQQAPV